MLLPTFATLLSFAGSAAAFVLDRRGVSTNAPHYSVYLNDEFSYSAWPSADKIKPYNRVLMAFWQTNGAQATPSSWQSFTDDQRQAILTDYHNNGIALMVSAFADDDHVISNKKDPVATAQQLAAWVKKYSVDGVDIDFEDFTPLQSDQANALDWLTKFHNELATQLPGYPVSSTPSAWMYGSAFGSANSVYCKLHSAVGSKISWYNMQLYNGQAGAWNTVENTFAKGANDAFLAIKEISDMCSIPQSMITVGKLWNKAELATSDSEDELPDAATLGQWIAQAKATTGYPQTGIMVWKAEKNNWDGAINYLSGAIAAMNSADVASAAAAASVSTTGAASPSASNATASASVGSNAAAAPANASDVAAVSISPSAVTGASGAATNSQSPAGSAGVAAASGSSVASGSKSGSVSGTAMGASATQTSGASVSFTLAPATIIAAVCVAMLV